jgi:DNA-directed RNA polymerase specialized sigma24 family protein
VNHYSRVTHPKSSLDAALDALRRGDRDQAWSHLARCQSWARWAARRFGRDADPISSLEDRASDALVIAFEALSAAARTGATHPAVSIATFAVRRAWRAERAARIATAELTIDPPEPEADPSGERDAERDAERARAARALASALAVWSGGSSLSANRGRRAAARAGAGQLARATGLVPRDAATRADVAVLLAELAAASEWSQGQLFEEVGA